MTDDEDDGIVITFRSWANHVVRNPCRFVIRHTSRTWFRLSRADRNRLRRGEAVRESAPCPRYRRTRAMRAALAEHDTPTD